MRTTIALCGVVIAAAVLTIGMLARPGETAATDRVHGPDRVGTAAQIALEAFEPRPETMTALVARGDDFADALAAGALAGAVRGPVLLSDHDRLPAATVERIAALEVDEVLVLGGVAAFSDAVVDALAAEVASVERVFGEDRYATAAAVAAAAAERTGEPVETVFVASGAAFADALAAGPAAYAARSPILLTTPETLAEPAARALDDLAPARVIVLGGHAAVRDEVVEAIAARGHAVERVAGPERTATAAALADLLLDEFGFDGGEAVLARGDAFPDALAVAPLAGEARAPVLLAAAPDLLDTASRRWLADRCASVARIRVVGGEAAIGAGPVETARYAAERCGEPERTFRVGISTRGAVASDVATFRRIVLQTLNDERGWALSGRIAFVEATGSPDLQVVLASPQAVGAAHPVCSAQWSCRVGNQALINDVRWRDGTRAFMGAGGDLDTYRRYVVNHEVGHWLGFGHVSCPETGAAAPVMQQQSINMQGCAPNGWPLDFERDQLAAWRLD